MLRLAFGFAAGDSLAQGACGETWGQCGAWKQLAGAVHKMLEHWHQLVAYPFTIHGLLGCVMGRGPGALTECVQVLHIQTLWYLCLEKCLLSDIVCLDCLLVVCGQGFGSRAMGLPAISVTRVHS